jgi:hypothetical protein
MPSRTEPRVVNEHKTPRPPSALEILLYLENQPHAQDTLDGLLDWWLLRNRMVKVSEVKAALRKLVEDDWLLVRRTMNGRVLYRLNMAKAPSLPGLRSKRAASHTVR